MRVFIYFLLSFIICYVYSKSLSDQFSDEFMVQVKNAPEPHRMADSVVKHIETYHSHNYQVTKRFKHLSNHFVVEMKGEKGADDLKREIPNVKAVYRSKLWHAFDTQSWGIDRIDQPSLPLNGYYNNTWNGSGVEVFIVDTGLDMKFDFLILFPPSQVWTPTTTSSQMGRGMFPTFTAPLDLSQPIQMGMVMGLIVEEQLLEGRLGLLPKQICLELRFLATQDRELIQRFWEDWRKFWII